jgi:hypothetical protein
MTMPHPAHNSKTQRNLRSFSLLEMIIVNAIMLVVVPSQAVLLFPTRVARPVTSVTTAITKDQCKAIEPPCLYQLPAFPYDDFKRGTIPRALTKGI